MKRVKVKKLLLVLSKTKISVITIYGTHITSLYQKESITQSAQETIILSRKNDQTRKKGKEKKTEIVLVLHCIFGWSVGISQKPIYSV